MSSGSTVGDAITEVAATLRDAGIENARAEARLLLSHSTGLPAEAVLAYPEAPLDPAGNSILREFASRRARREPLAHILGEREFWSLPFLVSADTLVPRPESETLVEAALDLLPRRTEPHRILDLGTGSGCLLISLLHEFPNAVGLGVDLNEHAVFVANENARRLGCGARARFSVGSWGQSIDARFDLVVSNPPYITGSQICALQPEVAEFEPRLALDGGSDGLAAYRAIIPDVVRLLRPGGSVVLEMGFDQRADVERIAARAGLSIVDVRHDLSGKPRCLIATQA